MSNVSFIASIILLIIAVLVALFALQVVMFFKAYILPILGWFIVSSEAQSTNGAAMNVSLSWHAPNASQINNRGNVINGTGAYGFTFNGSYVNSTNTYYGGYNWYCLFLETNRRIRTSSAVLIAEGATCLMSIQNRIHELLKSTS